MELRHNSAQNRYEAVEGGTVIGYTTTRARGDAVEMPHTVVEPDQDGKGVASAVVKFALDDLRKQGRRVVPTCSFVAGYIQRHPEYAALVAP